MPAKKNNLDKPKKQRDNGLIHVSNINSFENLERQYYLFLRLRKKYNLKHQGLDSLCVTYIKYKRTQKPLSLRNIRAEIGTSCWVSMKDQIRGLISKGLINVIHTPGKHPTYEPSPLAIAELSGNSI